MYTKQYHDGAFPLLPALTRLLRAQLGADPAPAPAQRSPRPSSTSPLAASRAGRRSTRSPKASSRSSTAFTRRTRSRRRPTARSSRRASSRPTSTRCVLLLFLLFLATRADSPSHTLLQDIAFLHAPTKTLIEADLLFNLPPTEQYSRTTARSTIPFLSGMMKPGSTGQKRFVHYLAAKDKKEMADAARKVASWDFGTSPLSSPPLPRPRRRLESHRDLKLTERQHADRIIPCHGDVIETGGKKGASSLARSSSSPPSSPSRSFSRATTDVNLVLQRGPTPTPGSSRATEQVAVRRSRRGRVRPLEEERLRTIASSTRSSGSVHT